MTFIDCDRCQQHKPSDGSVMPKSKDGKEEKLYFCKECYEELRAEGEISTIR